MLMTLFKHEMRATARTFLWIYAAFAAVAVANAIFTPMAVENAFGGYSSSSAFDGSLFSLYNNSIAESIQGIVFTLYGLSIVAVIIVTLIIVILRFYRNLLGDEGYLMMTLPVSREQNILAKLFAAVVWNLCTGGILFLSLLLLIARFGAMRYIAEAVNELIRQGAPVALWIALIVIVAVVSYAQSVLMLYAAMAIGPNMLKNRLGGSVLAFIIIYIANFVITAVASSIFFLSMATALEDSMRAPFFGFFLFLNPFGTAEDVGIAAVNMIFAFFIILSAVIAFVCWLLTRHMLKRKLNLA